MISEAWPWLLTAFIGLAICLARTDREDNQT